MGYYDSGDSDNMSEDSYNNDYDNDKYESSDDGIDWPNNEYHFPVSQGQFFQEIKTYINQVRNDPSSHVGRSKKINMIMKHMARVFSRNQVLFCVDVEAWEQDQTKITEIGIAIYDPRHQELSLSPHIKTVHIIIDEHKDLRNGKFVPDNRDEFLDGPSWYCSLSSARKFLQCLIDHFFDADFPLHCSLVGHDLKGDLKWLDQLGVKIAYNVRKLDTKKVFACTHGHNGASLKNALEAVRQPHSHLHNAGNDAYYTVLLALKLCDPSARHLSGFEYQSNEEDKSTVTMESLFDSLVF